MCGSAVWTSNRADDMRRVTVGVALCRPRSESRTWTRSWAHERSPKIDFGADASFQDATLGNRLVRERRLCHSKIERRSVFLSACLKERYRDASFLDAQPSQIIRKKSMSSLNRRLKVQSCRLICSWHAHVVGPIASLDRAATLPPFFPLHLFPANYVLPIAAVYGVLGIVDV